MDTTGAKVGTINIIDRERDDLTEDEIQLVEIFARYIAVVIEKDRMEHRLRNAQRMEIVGKLAAGVAHEVRNPLNAIQAIADALSQELRQNDEYQQFLVHIHTQVERLSVLMKDLLDLGKPVDKMHQHRESLDEICSSSLDIWRHSGHSRSHTVRLIKPQGDGSIFVAADSRRLQQVFLNLLDNAAQHSADGSSIQIVIHEPAGGLCSVEVVDSGSGIPDEILPRLFEPFFSTRRGGTGLGMSIVKHIVEAHGGTVSAGHTLPPPGCTIKVQLPLWSEKA
jgi:two-component system NtrC family sensor kinase